MSRDHYLLLCDVTADTENTASSIVACWTVFTQLLPGNALMKSVTICGSDGNHKNICIILVEIHCETFPFGRLRMNGSILVRWVLGF
jgi:hypothetical protein